MEWLRRLWVRLLDWIAPRSAPDFEPPKVEVELRPFNWLLDYGPLWEPGSTAFWLEPRKAGDLIAWLRKYRPEFEGEFEAAGLKVTVAAATFYPIPGAWMGNYGTGSTALAQMQAMQSQLNPQMRYNQYQNMLARQQGLSRNVTGLSSLFGNII